MSIDPQVRALLDAQAAAGDPPLNSMTVAAARQAARADDSMPAPEAVSAVDALEIPGPGGMIPVRVYRPGQRTPLPIVVYFHGGGFVLGDLDTYDPWCRHLAKLVWCLVVAVDYRLAPEHPFPAAVEDSIAVTEWLGAHAATIGGDPTRIAVVGDSAGGNLAAVVAQVVHARGTPALVHQVLLCPSTDHYDAGTPSYEEFATGYGMTRDDVVWLFDHYYPPTVDRDDARAFPLRARDLRGLPTAFVISAGCDVLRDEAAAYVARLREAGVLTRHSVYQGMIHNFQFSYDTLPSAQSAVAEIVAVLRNTFDPPLLWDKRHAPTPS